MVLASHLIITAYGFWLPNEDRGSWSDFVGSWELWKFGDATKVNTRISRAHIEHDRRRREGEHHGIPDLAQRRHGAARHGIHVQFFRLAFTPVL